jgi:purine-nucleoside/S-methyl-5'-thioadenosine phosphorylase / adenosine deaminase
MLFTTSALLGARHGFSTRLGGVSEGRYATLNVGAKWGDEPARVDENRRRLAAAAGFELARLYTAQQVHGATVVAVGATASVPAPAAVAAVEADALVATEPGAVVGVYTADCVPILLSDGAGRVAAVHAGWRGTVANIAAAAVEALVAAGARRDALVAALGPSICARCFEVGEEVAAEFDRVAPAAVHRATAGAKPHVDLHAANRALLERAGVARVDASPPCTRCDPRTYYSFRRDGARIGQHLSFIVAG